MESEPRAYGSHAHSGPPPVPEMLADAKVYCVRDSSRLLGVAWLSEMGTFAPSSRKEFSSSPLASTQYEKPSDMCDRRCHMAAAVQLKPIE